MNQDQLNQVLKYVNLFKKKWWLIASIVLVFGIISAYRVYSNISVNYLAKSTVYVASKQDESVENSIFTDLKLGDALINDYRELVKQKIIAKDVIEDLGISEKLSPEQLVSKINVSLINQSRIMEISVIDSNPQLAVELVNRVTEVFSKKIITIMNVESVQIIDIAEKAKMIPIENPRNQIVKFLLIGLVLSLGVVYGIDYLDSRIKTKEDLYKIFKLETLIEIPLVCKRFNRKKQIYSFLSSKDQLKRLDKIFNNHLNKKKIIVIEEYKHKISELFKIFSLSVKFKIRDNNIKKLLITSSVKNEGKTATCVNLAVTLAKMQQKVLLIDLNLRNPDIHNYFETDNSLDIISNLESDSDCKSCIQKSNINNLDLVIASEKHENPSELLASEKVNNFMNKVENEYDVIIFDSAPINNIVDTSLLAELCDGIILVVSTKDSKISSLTKDLEQIGRTSTKILGVVLNKI